MFRISAEENLLREDYVRQYAATKEIKRQIYTEEHGRRSKIAQGRQSNLTEWTKWKPTRPKEIIRLTSHFLYCLNNTELVGETTDSWLPFIHVLSNIELALREDKKLLLLDLMGLENRHYSKTLIGEIPSMQGPFQVTDRVTIGYFEQDLELEKNLN